MLRSRIYDNVCRLNPILELSAPPRGCRGQHVSSEESTIRPGAIRQSTKFEGCSRWLVREREKKGARSFLALDVVSDLAKYVSCNGSVWNNHRLDQFHWVRCDQISKPIAMRHLICPQLRVAVDIDSCIGYETRKKTFASQTCCFSVLGVAFASQLRLGFS